MLTMPYTSFTLAKVKKEFGLTTVEAGRFLPPIDPIAPSSRLKEALEDLPWAIAKRCCEAQIAVGSEKAKSEGIIYPILQREVLQKFVVFCYNKTFMAKISIWVYQQQA